MGFGLVCVYLSALRCGLFNFGLVLLLLCLLFLGWLSSWLAGFALGLREFETLLLRIGWCGLYVGIGTDALRAGWDFTTGLLFNFGFVLLLFRILGLCCFACGFV